MYRKLKFLIFYFAEICLLTNARRTASVIATTTCDVFILSAEDFRDVLEEHPNMRSLMEEEAQKRLTSLGTSVTLATKPLDEHQVQFHSRSAVTSTSTCSCSSSAHKLSEHVISREVVETAKSEQ